MPVICRWTLAAAAKKIIGRLALRMCGTVERAVRRSYDYRTSMHQVSILGSW